MSWIITHWEDIVDGAARTIAVKNRNLFTPLFQTWILDMDKIHLKKAECDRHQILI